MIRRLTAVTGRAAANDRTAADRGAAAAEMALIMPVLLLLVFGIIDFGRMLNAQITLTQAAREGARSQALGIAPEARVRAAAENLKDVRVEPGPACVPDAASIANAVVTVKYTFEFVTPVGALAALFGRTMDQTAELSGKGVMPCMP
jgi:Flp pilus assembly protein TadG